jgi:hypothetical protein
LPTFIKKGLFDNKKLEEIKTPTITL